LAARKERALRKGRGKKEKEKRAGEKKTVFLQEGFQGSSKRRGGVKQDVDFGETTRVEKVYPRGRVKAHGGDAQGMGGGKAGGKKKGSWRGGVRWD